MRAYAKKTMAPGLRSPSGRVVVNRAVTMSPANIRPALTINPPGDEYEQAADRVASQVMGKSALPPPPHFSAGVAKSAPQAGLTHQPLEVQRYASGTTGETTAPAKVGEMLSSAGQPLAGETRALMEARFGHDFSQVRVHADRAAADAAQSIAARAFTAGNHISFGAGQYRPHTPEGGWLLAHELTHVLQQRTGGPVIQRAETDDNPDFCFPQDGQPALEDVSGVLNGWIAEAQVNGKQNDLDSPAAINHELAQLADSITTVAERRIADLPKGQVRHVSLDESRYRIPGPLRQFYRSLGKSPVAPVINLCGVCVGADKVGHFFQQGGEYFYIGEALRERVRMWTPEERAAFVNQLAPGIPEDGVDLLPPVLAEDRVIEIYTDEYGKWLEGFPNRLPDQEIAWIRSKKLLPGTYFSGIYGWASSGVMSRGDLEANRQGGRFYRDAMRYPDLPLDMCHYVNDDWNEYSNPSSYGGVGLFTPISGPELPVDAIGEPLDFPIINLPQQGFVATIPFKTNSDYPDDAAMESLVNRLMIDPGRLKRGEFHLDFAGYASRLGDDEYNQQLSERRAQVVKGRLQFLIGSALANFDFEFYPNQFEVNGYGETHAGEESKSPDDDSQSDRVVEVVFEIR